MVMKVSSTPTYSDTVLPVEPRYIVLLNIIKKGAVCQPNNSNKSIIIIIHALLHAIVYVCSLPLQYYIIYM